MEQKNNIKIVHIAATTSGGAGIAALRLHEALLSEGYNSHMLVLRNPYGSTTKNISIYNPPKITHFAKRVLSKLKLYKSIVRQHISLSQKCTCEAFTSPYTLLAPEIHPLLLDADIIHLHWVSGFINYPSFFKSNRHTALFWTPHDLNPFSGFFHYKNDAANNPIVSIENEQITLFKRTILKKRKIYFTPPCEWMKEEIVNAQVANKDHIQVIPYCLNTNIFKYSEHQRQLKKELNLSPEKQILLFVSESINNHRKGMDILIGAIQQLDTSIQIVAIGKIPDQKEANIIYPGSISAPEEIAKYYQAADLFVLPSREDNLPCVMLEALCCGCPVVGFDHGGMKDAITNNVNGLRVKEMNSNALFNGLRETFNNLNYLNRQEISKQAHLKYSFQKEVSQMLPLYYKALSR